MAAFKNKDNGTWYVQFRLPIGRANASRSSSAALPPSEKRWNGNGSS